ncbi:hypothetical protein [Dolichospermum heterosporum]|uniref:Uncharacterized protein n=1 Tax=Dolichospermum heterosporum TAC447 TaxID=747523 RepID=A0ABY5LTN1_9CYAN|nr:hypothetical protein [Dolichospermum heterosporum]UUO13951.1 hypothetical protein NG743_18090 [Dolichospermum heterosporum TAC447]
MIPAERFAIAVYQFNLQVIPAGRFAIAVYQFNLRAIALSSINSDRNVSSNEVLGCIWLWHL